ncbi:MAG: hypothetical protein H6907_04055 [Hyphomicrobiales bacterium]|nr:hypothetical protein [Hyphomicrobiales bacterium]MCP5370884.1 hypothetical protein [Hyphomicrobiales bacterium]
MDVSSLAAAAVTLNQGQAATELSVEVLKQRAQAEAAVADLIGQSTDNLAQANKSNRVLDIEA